MIIIDNIRILTPDELLKILKSINDINACIKFLYIFSTGFRPSESNYILDNPDKIDYDKRIISFEDNRWDKARRFKPRKIYLSRSDLYNVLLYTKLNERMNTESYQINRNLKRWADKANINSLHIDSTSIRMTRMTWLLNLFPKFESNIIAASDFYGNINLYKNINFSNNDKLAMMCNLGDWSGSIYYK